MNDTETSRFQKFCEGEPEIEEIRIYLLAKQWHRVLHPQGRSYIEIVIDPEGPNPKKEYWCQP